jgi:hypothetical protein
LKPVACRDTVFEEPCGAVHCRCRVKSSVVRKNCSQWELDDVTGSIVRSNEPDEDERTNDAQQHGGALIAWDTVELILLSTTATHSFRKQNLALVKHRTTMSTNCLWSSAKLSFGLATASGPSACERGQAAAAA